MPANHPDKHPDRHPDTGSESRSNANCRTLTRSLKELADPTLAQHHQRFFKTGPGEYAEGDRFLGIKVPVIRRQIRIFRDMPLDEIQCCLRSPQHEIRMASLLIMVEQYRRADTSLQNRLYKLYCSHTDYINNWDLVDVTAPHIVGAHLLERPRDRLYQFARSRSLWKRRIAIIATHAFIRQHDFQDTLNLCELLLKDQHDLMHKATGWMLREIGKRNQQVEEDFLQQHYLHMPRTMLRYAIEKFPAVRRQQYLQGRL